MEPSVTPPLIVDASQKPERAVRPPGQDHVFQSPPIRPNVDPDRVGPVVEGYFYIPPIWIGEAPDPEAVQNLNPAVHHTAVIETQLTCGIRARANKDGLFLFDFTHWSPGKPVLVPGFVRPDGLHYRPEETEEAERKAEDVAVLRAVVMNAHQALLGTAQMLLRHSSMSIGRPVTAWSTYKAISLQAPIHYSEDHESLHNLLRNVANNKDRVAQTSPVRRRSIDVDVVQWSLSALDRLLADGDLTGIRLVEGAFMAANRRYEKRFGESITLGWTVCEQLVSITWNRMLDDTRVANAERMSKERRSKLLGRDYTASVKSEMLELSGRLSHDLFRKLEIARKARNRWAHEMRPPPEREVQVCLSAVEQLMPSVLGIQLRLGGGGRGGVPQWPVWMWPDFATTVAGA